MTDQWLREERDGDRRSLFLVELRVARGASGDLDRMQAALRHAVSRLGRSGVAIRWAGSVALPGDARCLCVVEATDHAQVALARDTAGLTASIQPTEEN
ncbi:MAG TPA: hypothetical protein VK908_07540 [Jiangellales bacterium]|nr:hypothetical protein [Jiangellales bacterium]